MVVICGAHAIEENANAPLFRGDMKYFGGHKKKLRLLEQENSIIFPQYTIFIEIVGLIAGLLEMSATIIKEIIYISMLSPLPMSLCSHSKNKLSKCA